MDLPLPPSSVRALSVWLGSGWCGVVGVSDFVATGTPSGACVTFATGSVDLPCVVWLVPCGFPHDTMAKQVIQNKAPMGCLEVVVVAVVVVSLCFNSCERACVLWLGVFYGFGGAGTPSGACLPGCAGCWAGWVCRVCGMGLPPLVGVLFSSVSGLVCGGFPLSTNNLHDIECSTDKIVNKVPQGCLVLEAEERVAVSCMHQHVPNDSKHFFKATVLRWCRLLGCGGFVLPSWVRGVRLLSVSSPGVLKFSPVTVVLKHASATKTPDEDAAAVSLEGVSVCLHVQRFDRKVMPASAR